MSKLKEIEKWYEIAENFTEDSQDFFNTDVMIRYIYSYYKRSLSDLLAKEYEDIDNESADSKIKNVILLASSKTCKTLSEELARKYIHRNVERINRILTKTQLSEHTVIANNNDIIQSFYDTESMLNNLIYENNPIIAFQGFLRTNNIKIESGNSMKYIFEFTFKEKEMKQYGKFKCNTIYEFLDYCAAFLLEKVNKELLLNIKYSPNVIKTIPHEVFEYEIAAKLKNHELYQYLYHFEYIRMNFSLADLYLLLYYNEIDEFKNKTLMKQLRITSE